MCPSGMSAPGMSDVKRLWSKEYRQLDKRGWFPLNCHELHLWCIPWTYSIGSDSLACTHAVRALPLSRTTKEAKRSFLVAIVRRENCLIWFLIDFSFIARQFSFLLVCHAAAQCFATQLTYTFIRKAACLCFSVGCHLVRFTYLPFNYLCPRLSLTATAFATTAFVGRILQVGKDKRDGTWAVPYR